MARENLHQFLVDLSKAADLLESFKLDPKAAMTAAGLNAEEQSLVTARDEKALQSYIGDISSPAAFKIAF